MHTYTFDQLDVIDINVETSWDLIDINFHDQIQWKKRRVFLFFYFIYIYRKNVELIVS
jgi:hypothetical protein